MDHRLIAWARAVKARRRGAGPPPLWLFTEPARMPALEAVIAGLPRGLCGVVFRHDGVPGRAALLGRVARRCRERRLALVVAGRCPLPPPGAGRHLRSGRGPLRPRGLLTSSAHGPADLARARRAGAALAFISPAFPTSSHPAARALGALGWARLAVRGGVLPYALGGVSGRTAPGLPRWAFGAGAIDALVQ